MFLGVAPAGGPLPAPRARDVPGAGALRRPTAGRRSATAAASSCACRRPRCRRSRRPREPARDDFDRPALAPAWNFMRNPNAGDVSLTARPGFLRLDRLGGHAGRHRRRPPRSCSGSGTSASRCRAALDFAPRAGERGGGADACAPATRFTTTSAVRARRRRGREAVLTSRIAGASSDRRPRADPRRRRSTLEVSADETSYTFAVARRPAARQVLGALPDAHARPPRRSASTARTTSPAR